MFEVDDSPGLLNPALEYFLQLLVVCPVVTIAGIVLSPVLSILDLSGKHPAHITFGGYIGILCLFVGIVAGWIIGRKAHAFARIGRWIWVLPTLILSPEIFHEVFSSRPVPRLPELFFSTGGNEGIGVLLFLLPACSVVGYSLGVSLIGKKPWVTAAAGVALLSLLVIAHGFEHSRIEKWSRIRTVIDRSGLLFSADANRLCTPGTSSGGLLSNGTMVEGLERQVCFNGRLFDRAVQRPADAWTIERVKVLTGSRIGAEGWVLAYGLQEEMER